MMNWGCCGDKSATWVDAWWQWSKRTSSGNSVKWCSTLWGCSTFFSRASSGLIGTGEPWQPGFAVLCRNGESNWAWDWHVVRGPRVPRKENCSQFFVHFLLGQACLSLGCICFAEKWISHQLLVLPLLFMLTMSRVYRISWSCNYVLTQVPWSSKQTLLQPYIWFLLV